MPPPPSYPGAWARTYGGTSGDLSTTGEVVMMAASYVIGGRLQGNSLGWVLRLNLDGTIAWQKSYATAGTTLISLDAAPSGGLIFAASTTSMGAGNSDPDPGRGDFARRSS